jgi:Flp pilus assembly protein protease CpaA
MMLTIYFSWYIGSDVMYCGIVGVLNAGWFYWNCGGARVMVGGVVCYGVGVLLGGSGKIVEVLVLWGSSAMAVSIILCVLSSRSSLLW